MTFHKEISGYLTDFVQMLSDAPPELALAEEEWNEVAVS
jgi:hypothetical protein